MDYQFRFWHSLFNPSKFAFALDNQDQGYQIKGYRMKFFVLFFVYIGFYIMRDLWGMGTDGLTYFSTSNLYEEYVVSRYLSILGAAIEGMLFFLFHYYIISFCLYVLTDLPFRSISKIQLFVITSILIEKVILFIVFVMVGYTTPLSFLSFGPLTSYLVDDSFVIYFLNQITVATVVTVVIQYVFISKWEEESKGILLTKIIIVQLFFALLTAAISVIPLKDYLLKVVGL